MKLLLNDIKPEIKTYWLSANARRALKAALVLSTVLAVALPTAAIADSDSSATFTINGSTQSSGDTIYFGYGTSSVSVSVYPTDPGATYSVSGDGNLYTGTNTVSVVVTATDGSSSTSSTFYVVVNSPPLSNDSSATFTINGTSQNGGDTVYVSYGTSSVSVGVSPTDSGASYNVYGASSLYTGSNSISVVVTAADGSSSTSYFTIYVNSQSSDSSATFTVNGNVQNNWDTIYVNYGTTSVSVGVTPTDSGASYTIYGNGSLYTGSNSLSIYVTAANGSSTTNYYFTVYVNYPSSNSSATFTVNGNSQGNGDTIYVGYGTTSVNVAVTPADSGASYMVYGASNLYTGSNSVSVSVTAPDGMNTTYTYFTVIVNNPSSDSSATFAINGSIQFGGDTIYVGYGTSSVSVVVTPTDSGASSSVNGHNNLYTGSNSVTVVVTAPDGYGSTTTYFTVVVNGPPSSDSSATFTINGNSQGNGDTIYVAYGTSSVNVSVYPTDSGASSSVSGQNYLYTGSNLVTAVVTAADGYTSTTSYFTVVVNGPPSSDSSAAFTFNGNTQVSGDTINVVYGTTSVTVVTSPTDSGATSSITGESNLYTGSNSVTIIVTAADGYTTTTSNFTVVVDIASSDSTATFTINGASKVNGDTVTVGFGTSSVTVVTTPTNSGASAVVSGDSGLATGTNAVVVVVTASDGSSTTSTFTVIVSAAPIYTVHFANNGHGTAYADISTSMILFLNLPLEANDGYFTFLGWSTSTSAAGILTGAYTPTSEGSTLTAIWRNDTPARVVVIVRDPVQQDSISSYSSDGGSIAGGDVITILGNFPARIVSISLDGFFLPQSAWTWSVSKVTFTMPAHVAGVVEIQLWNGQAPVLQSFSYTYLNFVASKVAVEAVIVEASESNTVNAPIVEVIPPVALERSESSVATVSVPKVIVISFAAGSSSLLPAQAKKLTLPSSTKAISVTGYAEPSNPKSDVKLSQKRASSVAAYLAKKYPSLKITVSGKGGSISPLCTSSRNRCVVIVKNG